MNSPATTALHSSRVEATRLDSTRLAKAKLVCGMRLNKWKSLKPQSSGKQTNINRHTQKILLCYREFCFIFRNCQSNINQSNRVGDGLLPWWISDRCRLCCYRRFGHALRQRVSSQVGQVFGQLSVACRLTCWPIWHCFGFNICRLALTFLKCLTRPFIFQNLHASKNFTLFLLRLFKLIQIFLHICIFFWL